MQGHSIQNSTVGTTPDRLGMVCPRTKWDPLVPCLFNIAAWRYERCQGAVRIYKLCLDHTYGCMQAGGAHRPRNDGPLAMRHFQSGGMWLQMLRSPWTTRWEKFVTSHTLPSCRPCPEVHQDVCDRQTEYSRVNTMFQKETTQKLNDMLHPPKPPLDSHYLLCTP